MKKSSAEFCLAQDRQTLFLKVQVINILRFTVSVTTIQPCPCTLEAALDDM